MTRDEAIRFIAGLGYGRQNAESWVLHAAFNDSWSHPAGCLIITWNSANDTYTVTEI